MKALVIGAGLAGCVAARRLAEAGHKVRLLEKRPDIGGNCRDEHRDGILVHCYGAHIFHTDNAEVWNFLTRFTDWRPYRHFVFAELDGQRVPVPPNLDTVEALCGAESAKRMADPRYHDKPIRELCEAEDEKVAAAARTIYERLYVPYAKKQWGPWADEVGSQISGRVRFNATRANHYFSDRWQAIPVEGYSAMMSRMVSHCKIDVVLEADGLTEGLEHWGLVIYTGSLDDFGARRYGQLPYRSLHFEWTRSSKPYLQDCPVVNHPEAPGLIRTVEHKRITGQNCQGTALSREYPCDYAPEKNVPMYPIPSAESIAAQYRHDAEQCRHVRLVGRLAEYRYYNMDDVVARAMEVTEKCESS